MKEIDLSDVSDLDMKPEKMNAIEIVEGGGK